MTNNDEIITINLIGDDLGYRWGWSKESGPTGGGEIPRHFLFGSVMVKELSIFVDESGDFDNYEYHSPFYMLTMVFHDRSVDISTDLHRLKSSMNQSGIPDYTFHAGPLIRRDKEYKMFDIEERKKMFNHLFNFVRSIDISYYTIIVEKRHVTEDLDLIDRLTKKLSSFLSEHLRTLTSYDQIHVYYDYGQRELAKLLISSFNTALRNVRFKKVIPANYKLFQAADMFCTLELLAEKVERKMLTSSELTFFKSERKLKKTYLRTLEKKRFK